MNRSASLAMSTSVLKALPGKLDIKRHSPSILYITLYSFRNTLGCRKTCFSPHTGGTAGAIFNVLGCQFRDPVLVEVRSKNSFYGHSFPSAVSIRASLLYHFTEIGVSFKQTA